MNTQHFPILITLCTTAHLTPTRPQTHCTDWSVYQRALEDLHIGKSSKAPPEKRRSNRLARIGSLSTSYAID
ncbi:hypothetical protein EVAR_81494_1 [Eumeta japonica]|uniref:Uncharacterized protein n=1 Tax=Eumeta variegata TaxID=151549 RepID=A0A4C1VZP5_EUMVA|nr:hypothetical protein EVAR_81494_1 [Eumeta japonica]